MARNLYGFVVPVRKDFALIVCFVLYIAPVIVRQVIPISQPVHKLKIEFFWGNS